MLVVYDLDKTSLYCPIALWLDDSFLKRLLPSKIFYGLYSFVYILEMMFGQFKINKAMRERAIAYSKGEDVGQLIITARHLTYMTRVHAELVFKDTMKDMLLVCVATGETGLTKAEVLYSITKNTLEDNERIIIYDDSDYELEQYEKVFKDQVTCFKVDFDGKDEIIKCV